jgi:cell division transport system ATP-binding protein
MSQPNIITLNNVSHTYSSGVNALSGVSLHIPVGSCLIVTGHSGAGKTTLLKAVRGDIHPTGGSIFIHGFNLATFSNQDALLLKQSTGYIEQDTHFLSNMTVRENLTFFAELNDFDLPNVDALLDRVHLLSVANNQAHELSRGQRQILQTVRAVMHKPFLLIADEPIAHLDEYYVSTITTLFRELQASGTTIIIATHRSDPFNTLPNRIAIEMEKGRIIKQSQHI